MIGGLKPYPEYKESGVPWLGRIYADQRRGAILAPRASGTPCSRLSVPL